MTNVPKGRPGSTGEHDLQKRYGTQNRAENFYRNQMLTHLNDEMRRFVARCEMVFIATADHRGECDCSLRCGDAGFVQILDEHHLTYPEYRGNGVLASLGNLSTNGHIGLFFPDFFQTTAGLHVNGPARIVSTEEISDRLEENAELQRSHQEMGGKAPECWVEVEVEEAYIHCAKHIPLLRKLDKKRHWGTDDETQKGGDLFQAKTTPSPWKKTDKEPESGIS